MFWHLLDTTRDDSGGAHAAWPIQLKSLHRGVHAAARLIQSYSLCDRAITVTEAHLIQVSVTSFIIESSRFPVWQFVRTRCRGRNS
jgi:hypothetical protein